VKKLHSGRGSLKVAQPSAVTAFNDAAAVSTPPVLLVLLSLLALAPMPTRDAPSQFGRCPSRRVVMPRIVAADSLVC